MSGTILVLGGTGLLGAPVARRLTTDGFSVRLLARDPEKARKMFDNDGAALEVVPGDVADVGSLERAMVGASGVHISIGGPLDQLSAENVAALAPKLDVERITYLSGSTVCEENRWFPMTAQKLEAEKAVREYGGRYTIFSPTWPMEQLPRMVQGGRAAVIGNQPPVHWFAADDLARMVSTAYQRAEAANQRFFVHGPEALTMVEALERYCRAFHPAIESVAVMPVEAARGMAESTGDGMLKFYAEMMAYFEKVGEPGDPTEANEILGAPTATLDEWIDLRRAETA